MAEPKIPTTQEEAAAVEKTLAQFRLNRLNAAKAVMSGENITKLMAEVNELIAGGLPTGTTAKGHIEQLPTWITQVLAGLDTDIKQVENQINPPVPPAMTSGLTSTTPVPTA